MKTIFVLITVMAASGLAQTREPITAVGRLQWVVKGTIGPKGLTAGVFTAGLGTLRNSPKEYGPHWEGFGKRYGMRLTGSATSNLMEASLGAIWGEDPRYVRASGQPFGSRVKNIFKSTVLAHDREGNWMPAYARYTAIPSANFLANTWRVDSHATAEAAAIRTGMGVVGRVVSNAFSEFWPEVTRYVFRQGN